MNRKSTNPNGLWNASFGEIGATLKVLQDHGVTLNHLARLRSDSDTARRVAELIRGAEAIFTPKQARAILGKNFWGFEEWQKFYDARFDKEHLSWPSVNRFPWDAKFLESPCPFNPGKKIKETHFAFLGLQTLNGEPLTIMKLHELHPQTIRDERGLQLIAEGQEKVHCLWYSRYEFATRQLCGFRWYLMPIEPVPMSTLKAYTEQVKMLPVGYEVPLTVEEITKRILLWRKSHIRFHPLIPAARCQDANIRDNVVFSCAHNEDHTFHIVSVINDYSSPHIGITASVKA